MPPPDLDVPVPPGRVRDGVRRRSSPTPATPCRPSGPCGSRRRSRSTARSRRRPGRARPPRRGSCRATRSRAPPRARAPGCGWPTTTRRSTSRARMWDSHPDSIIANLVRRDGFVASDRFLLLLDPYHDHRSGYYFGVNAAGVLCDGTLLNDVWSDESWDGVWEGRARRDDQGLDLRDEDPVLAAALPRRGGAGLGRQLAPPHRAPQRGGLLRLQPKSGSGFVSRFPHLVGLQNGHRSRSIELVPYTTGKAEYLVHDAGDPFHDGSRYTPAMGGDLRTGVGNNLTLNATVNPDFGQVEVDPAVVNLSDVESYFSEKRPFFTENSRIFGNFGQEGARTTGASTGRSRRSSTPAASGARRRASVPGRGRVQRRADGDAHPRRGEAHREARAEPQLRHAARGHRPRGRAVRAGRAASRRPRSSRSPTTAWRAGSRSSRAATTASGAMTTLVQRRFDGGGLEDALNRQSLMTGLDGWHFLDRKKVWVLSGWAAMSRVAGTAAAHDRPAAQLAALPAAAGRAATSGWTAAPPRSPATARACGSTSRRGTSSATRRSAC